MKYLLPVVVLLAAGCGGASSDSSESPVANKSGTENPTAGENKQSGDVVPSSDVVGSIASMTHMLAKHEAVSEQNVTGTWVASWTIRSERSDIVAAPRISQYPDLLVKRTEFVVIRPASNGSGVEMASCNGNGIETATLSGETLSTNSRKLALVSNKEMAISEVVKRDKVVVPRLNKNFDYEPSFAETKTLNAKYIKVSDSYDSLASFVQDWRPTTLQPTDKSHAEIEKDIYCVQLDHVTNAGLYTLRLGSDDKMQLHVTGSDYNPLEPMAYASEPGYQGPLSGLIDTGTEACKANLDVSHDGSDGRISARFLIEKNGGDRNAVGSENLDINLR